MSVATLFQISINKFYIDFFFISYFPYFLLLMPTQPRSNKFSQQRMQKNFKKYRKLSFFLLLLPRTPVSLKLTKTNVINNRHLQRESFRFLHSLFFLSFSLLSSNCSLTHSHISLSSVKFHSSVTQRLRHESELKIWNG